MLYKTKRVCKSLVNCIRGKEPWFEFRYAAITWWHGLTWPFRWTWYGLENVWAYLPLIWHDRDWDYCFMLDLWEKKFRRMAYAQDHGIHTMCDRYGRQLRVCAALCKRLREDKYSDIPYDRHDEKWGKANFGSEPTENPHLFRMTCSRTNVRTADDEKQEREESRRIHDHAEKQRQSDLDYLTQLISKKMFHWWD